MNISFARYRELFTTVIVIVRIVNQVQCIICRTPLVACGDGRDCIRDDTQCDGLTHCNDGSDEEKEFCLNYSCPKGSFKCKDGTTCILKSYQCDGEKDCPDNSDEVSCPQFYYKEERVIPLLPIPSDSHNDREVHELSKVTRKMILRRNR